MRSCKAATNTLGESWSTIAQFDLDLDDTLPEFHCHPGDFAQVIVHLLTKPPKPSQHSRDKTKDD
jgi:hypothetical protein